MKEKMRISKIMKMKIEEKEDQHINSDKLKSQRSKKIKFQIRPLG